MSKFTEEKLEKAFIELLANEGYPHHLGNTIIRDDDEVLIEEDLKKYLLTQYRKQGLTETEVQSIILSLKTLPSSDLYESNKTVMRWLADGFILKREDHSQKDLHIELIDYKGVPPQQKSKYLDNIVAEKQAEYGSDNNIYKFVNQLEIVGTEKRIPDGIIYINGLPVVVFEFKSAIREEATINDAYIQLTTRYKRDIPELFKYNALCVISDGVNNKAGSFFAPYEFYYGWQRSNVPLSNLSQGERGSNLKQSTTFEREVMEKDSKLHYRGGFHFSGLVSKARELRKNQTPAEQVMWELLRNKQFLSLKFRRQHQIGDYIVDFFCNKHKLIIELDGEIHNVEKKQKKDKTRDAYFKSLGFFLLRFTNNEFLINPEKVLEKIENIIKNNSSINTQTTYNISQLERDSQSPFTKSFSPTGRDKREGSAPAEGINSLYTMIEGLFNQNTLRDVIQNFIFMPDSSKKDEKIVCRYPQYYAARTLFENIKNAEKPEGDGKGGTYFGATGSGKSFTMLYLVRLLMKSTHFNNPTIVLITDRTDLDDQLSGQFTNAKKFIGDNSVKSVESRAELRELIQGRQSGGVFLTTIHKFTEDTNLLSDRTNVICISDEAHRSQTNLDQKVKVTSYGVKKSYGFAKYLHDSFPNATYVGFTGTPIDATLDVFGKVIDAYTMTESVRDEITVRIVYEGRAAKIALRNRELEKIEKYYEEAAEEGANEYQIEKSKEATATMNSILGDSDRLQALAEDFVKHYDNRVSEGATVKGKAMFVCSSREIAYEFYKNVIALRPEWAKIKICEPACAGTADREGAELTTKGKREIKPMERIKMIMTRGKDDPKEMYDLLGTKEYRKELGRQFKNEKSNFKIAIIVDMWLTGFDVPFLDSIYIDKPIRQHNLIQTISRVNRKFKGKNKGLVVDYIGIKKQMNLALAKYNKGEEENFEDIQESLIVVRNHLDLLVKVFHKFDNSKYFNGSALEQLNTLNMAAEYVQLSKELEIRFMGLVKRLKAAYDICAGSEELTQKERDYTHFYLAVRSIVFKLTKGNAPDTAQMNAKVREMIKDALESDGVQEIFKLGDESETEQDIFDEDYLAKIDNIKLPNTKIKLLQQLLAKAIGEIKKVNKVKGIDFSKKMKSLVERYNERKEDDVLRSEVYEEMAGQLTDLIWEVHKEFSAGDELGINFEEKAFYDILKDLCVKYDFSYPEDKLIILSKAVKDLVDAQAKFPDWNKRNDIKSALKVGLILLLDKYGYPPVERDEVYKDIFEQAENFKKNKTL